MVLDSVRTELVTKGVVLLLDTKGTGEGGCVGICTHRESSGE